MKDDDKLLKQMMHIIYSPENIDKRKILVVSKYSERTRVNLLLLKYFLVEMNMRGIFITIDRPHQYIEYLLGLHGISQKKLLYIDMVSRMSGETTPYDGSNVFFMDGPYEVGFMNKLVDGCYRPDPVVGDIPQDYVNLKEMDFILVDDIAALKRYLDDDGVLEFVGNYLASIERLATVTAPIVLDVNNNRHLYEFLRNGCEFMVLIDLMKSQVRQIKSGRRARVPEPSAFPNPAVAGVD